MLRFPLDDVPGRDDARATGRPGDHLPRLHDREPGATTGALPISARSPALVLSLWSPYAEVTGRP
ncbi:hypothetical protein ACFQYP_16290 [Nonomuraea antimicrobica]